MKLARQPSVKVMGNQKYGTRNGFERRVKVVVAVVGSST
jgi:hypothetical protein